MALSRVCFRLYLTVCVALSNGDAGTGLPIWDKMSNTGQTNIYKSTDLPGENLAAQEETHGT